MAATDISNISSTILKTLYSNDAIDDLTLQDSPALGIVKKDEGFDGYDFKEFLEYGDIKGVGQIFSTSQTNASGTNDACFSLTRVKTYAIAQITGEAIEASKRGNTAAFVPVLKRQTDSAFHAVGQSLSHQLFRNKYGARGTISAITNAAPSVITLTNIDDVVNFEIGMGLKCGTTESGALHHATADVIAAIDRDAGTLTMTSNCVTGYSWAANDYIFRDSDTDATGGAGSSGLCMSGFDSWVPSSAPSATPFFGLARNVDVTRLGGIRFDASSYNVQEGLIKALQRAGRDNCYPDHIFMNPGNFGDLVNLMGTKTFITESAWKNPNIGYEGVSFVGPRGPVKIFLDPFCPVNVAYALTMRTWTLRSLGKAPHVLKLDTNELLRQASADAYELRVGAYYQLGCSAPGLNVRIKLA